MEGAREESVAAVGKYHACVRCGAEFEPMTHRKLFCSRECRLESSLIEKECNQCGKVFRQEPGLSGFCSISCAAKHNSAKHGKFEKKNEQTCAECGEKFMAAFKNKKFCSKKCHYQSRLIIKNCRQCGIECKQKKCNSGFCSRSCGAKWNIENGNCEEWRLRTNEKTGFYAKCPMCDNQVYFPPRFEDRAYRKTCSKECEHALRSMIFKGESNPFFGKKMTSEMLAKQKVTLMKNHGVTNAYMLSRHRNVSRPQKEIFNFLREKMVCDEFECEKFVHSDERRYFADIISESHKIIIEFFGDYWHANPIVYDETFYNKKKMKTAREIWQEDELRLDGLKSCGYKTFVVWERDFKTNKDVCLQQLIEKIGECKQ